MNPSFFSSLYLESGFFSSLYLESGFLSVAYLTVANLAWSGISVHCQVLLGSQYLVRRFSQCWITGGHTIHSPIEGLVPPTGIEPTSFQNLASKVAGLQTHATSSAGSKPLLLSSTFWSRSIHCSKECNIIQSVLYTPKAIKSKSQIRSYFEYTVNEIGYFPV